MIAVQVELKTPWHERAAVQVFFVSMWNFASPMGFFGILVNAQARRRLRRGLFGRGSSPKLSRDCHEMVMNLLCVSNPWVAQAARDTSRSALLSARNMAYAACQLSALCVLAGLGAASYFLASSQALLSIPLWIVAAVYAVSWYTNWCAACHRPFARTLWHTLSGIRSLEVGW